MDEFVTDILIVIGVVVAGVAFIWLLTKAPEKSCVIREVSGIGEWLCVHERKVWFGEETKDCIQYRLFDEK